MGSAGFDFYAGRFGAAPPQLRPAPRPSLGFAIVVPCYNEPSLLPTLDALWNCARPGAALEVLLVVNSATDASAEVIARNATTLSEVRTWAEHHVDPDFVTHLIHAPNLPPKTAGVGLARKIGMDEAARRLDSLGRLDAPILCFDADSLCDPNYLVEIDAFFSRNPCSPGCSIYFEHPLAGDEPPRVYEAIALYELHLRYYVEALRYTGFPHAFHTIGSSMAVRAGTYLKQGGMNKRKAGEDFYFLHKIIPLGHFGEVNTTRVIPSPRPSDRVPFGTGRAVRAYLETGSFATYPLQAFDDLRALFSSVPELFLSEVKLPPPIEQFLAAQDFPKALLELRANTNSVESFTKRFFRWFDGFRAMKFIHFARDRFYGEAPVNEAARSLLLRIDSPEVARATTLDLLQAYRARQRNRSPNVSA